MQAKHAKPNKLALRVLSTAAVMTMVTSIAAPAFADAYGIAEYKTWYVSDGNISVDGKLVTITDSTGAVIHQETDDDPDGITITGKSNTNNVTLKDTTVTISDLEIDASETGKAAISSNGKTIIELDGNNVLTGGKDHAALEKESHATNNAANPNYTLTITDSNNNGKLTAKGGENGAGIGNGANDAVDTTVTPADVADTAQDETAAVTPAGAQSTVQADTASTLPQTGVNWLAALASALSGVALLTAGLFLNRKESKH